MGKYTKKDVLELIEEEDVEFIRLQFTDIFGVFKNIAITASQMEKVLDCEFMFDCSSIAGFNNEELTDMYLYPDIDTFEIFPWRPQQGKVARLICNLYYSDRTPLETDPRYILRKVLKDAEMLGYEFNVGPECEFFLYHVDDNNNPTTISHETAGYFDMAPIDMGENARRDMVLTLEDMGFEIEASHHESAPAQHEIDFKYGSALEAADNIMTLKLTVKTIAKRHGLHATFMPKPKCDVDGSGMHINMSLSKEGKNAFVDETSEDGLSKTAHYFIGGLLKHMKAVTAVANPLVNSYKRLVPGFEAPVYIGWSMYNRSQVARIPASRKEETRIELRSPDSTANPYLVLAVCLAAGLEGIKKQIASPEPIVKHIEDMTEAERKAAHIEILPGNLLEAVNELEKDSFICGVLGKKLVQQYIDAKKEEWKEYTIQVTSWEIENNLYKY
ncbi:MAG: type I glutamate--ammonia ligase [Lachnospiraceae bacterium]